MMRNEKTAPKKTGREKDKAKSKKKSEDIEEENFEEPMLDNDLMMDTSSVAKTKGRHPIHCLTIVGQIEGHTESPSGTKSTKYEHVIPLLVAIEEDPEIQGLMVILNTVGGDVEAGLAIAELIAGMSKPTVSLVLGGGHSIGIPLAVAAQRSFIVPTATMTVHPVRHTGMVLGVPQTMRHFDRMQERITGFIVSNSKIQKDTFSKLLMKTGELVLDVGTVLDGEQAVESGLIDEMGSLADAIKYLYKRIEKSKK
jgi:ATP-dependent protease ClpP protease subunit